MNPIVSIIVPNYNHEEFLVQRLESIFKQTYRNFEVILLDDCSTDNSIQILKRYIDHPQTSHYIFNKKNSGSPFKQWNRGINLAKGEFIWIAESDDFCDENFLKKLIPSLIENQETVLSFCQSQRIDRHGLVTGNWITHTEEYQTLLFDENFRMEGNKFIEHYLIHKNVIPNVSAVLIRKSAIDKIVPLTFYSFMKYNADWYYYIQLLCNSKVAFVSESLNYFRYHENSVIAKADSESGLLKIYKMRVKIRGLMLKYFRSQNLQNFENIEENAKRGTNRLYHLIGDYYLKRKNYVRFLYVAYKRPLLLKNLMRELFLS